MKTESQKEKKTQQKHIKYTNIDIGIGYIHYIISENVAKSLYLQFKS